MNGRIVTVLDCVAVGLSLSVIFVSSVVLAYIFSAWPSGRLGLLQGLEVALALNLGLLLPVVLGVVTAFTAHLVLSWATVRHLMKLWSAGYLATYVFWSVLVFILTKSGVLVLPRGLLEAFTRSIKVFLPEACALVSVVLVISALRIGLDQLRGRRFGVNPALRHQMRSFERRRRRSAAPPLAPVVTVRAWGSPRA